MWVICRSMYFRKMLCQTRSIEQKKNWTQTTAPRNSTIQMVTIWLWFMGYSIHKSKTVVFSSFGVEKNWVWLTAYCWLRNCSWWLVSMQLHSFMFFKCYEIILSIKGSKCHQNVLVFAKIPLFKKYCRIAFWRFSTLFSLKCHCHLF